MAGDRYWGVRGMDGRWIGARTSAAFTKQDYTSAVVVLGPRERVGSFHNSAELARKAAGSREYKGVVTLIADAVPIDRALYREILERIELAELPARIARARKDIAKDAARLAKIEAAVARGAVRKSPGHIGWREVEIQEGEWETVYDAYPAQYVAREQGYLPEREAKVAKLDAKLAKLTKKYGGAA